MAVDIKKDLQFVVAEKDPKNEFLETMIKRFTEGGDRELLMRETEGMGARTGVLLKDANIIELTADSERQMSEVFSDTMLAALRNYVLEIATVEFIRENATSENLVLVDPGNGAKGHVGILKGVIQAGGRAVPSSWESRLFTGAIPGSKEREESAIRKAEELANAQYSMGEKAVRAGLTLSLLHLLGQAETLHDFAQALNEAGEEGKLLLTQGRKVGIAFFNSLASHGLGGERSWWNSSDFQRAVTVAS